MILLPGFISVDYNIEGHGITFSEISQSESNTDCTWPFCALSVLHSVHLYSAQSVSAICNTHRDFVAVLVLYSPPDIDLVYDAPSIWLSVTMGGQKIKCAGLTQFTIWT